MIEAVAPSDVFSWPGIDVQLTWQSERTGIENKWFARTGRVVAVKVEADGDLHIALQDATVDKVGIVVCEVPVKPLWCEIRNIVFGWTRTRFPLHIRSTRKLTLNEAPIVTVVGKAFWDIGHAPKDQPNRRKNLPGYAVWEIHPAMKITGFVTADFERLLYKSKTLRIEVPFYGQGKRIFEFDVHGLDKSW